MSFEQSVNIAITKEFPGIFAGKPTFVTTALGQKCAVYVNQGITYTSVTLYFEENGKLKILSETFFFAYKATKFAAKLVELIPQENYVQVAWETAKMVYETYKFVNEIKNSKDVLFN